MNIFGIRVLRCCRTFNGCIHHRRQLSNVPQGTAKATVFSGIQPTGVLHVGNYFGAVSKWLEYQRAADTQLYICVVDLHSITTNLPDRQTLSKLIVDMGASLLACGIQPDKCVLFQQSLVPQHCELAWLLSCLSTLPALSRLPQYKEKAATFRKDGDIPLALLIYPVLQAADILLYKASHVPVGEDQSQHLEIAKHLARKFNAIYDMQYFPVPEQIHSPCARLKSLRKPDKKMSKSEMDQRSRIDVSDSAEIVTDKLKKAVTDFTSEVTFDPEQRPGVSNLIALHSAASGLTTAQCVQMANDINTGQYKLLVAEALNNQLAPIRDEYSRVKKDVGYVTSVLSEGSERASAVAQTHITQIKEIIGLI